MNDTIKAITIGAIVVALYIALKHARPTTNGPGVSTQSNPQAVIEQTPCGAALPMETTTCAIPLAADYLPAALVHNPATAPISTRPIFAQPLDRQTSYVVALGPVNVPYGVCGRPVTPNTAPLDPCAFGVQCCVLASCKFCTVKV